jgi:hypothetical protein
VFFNVPDSSIVLASPATFGVDTVYPDIGSWQTTNSTLFYPATISGEQFDTITSDWHLYEAISVSDQLWFNQLRKPGISEVFHIRLEDRFGLIKIDTLASETEGFITFFHLKHTFQ